MIKVDIFLQEDEIVGFNVKGHAGFGPYGQDIVCAAISVLTQTAVYGLQHFLTEEPEVEVEEGVLRCKLPKVMTARERLQATAILETMYLGLLATENSYQDFLQVRRRCAKC